MPKTSKGYVTVDGDTDGTILLTMEYSHESLSGSAFGTNLMGELLSCYKRRRDELVGSETDSCVIVIESDFVASPVRRALFELWREVVGKTGREGGQVVCVKYPSEYIGHLRSLGMLDLPGFSLADDKDTAVRMVTGRIRRCK